MIELEEGFSDNDRYLINEHLKNGTDDFLLAGLGDKTFVVPYKYRKAAKDEVSAIELFKRVLLDFQAEEVRKYQEAGVPVRAERVDGADYVVPFRFKDQRVSREKLAAYVEKRAAAKYNMIIEMCRELEKRGVVLGNVDFSLAALAKYQHHLKQICGKEAQGAEQVRAFCSRAKGKISKKFRLSAEQIGRQAGVLAKKTGDFASKHTRAVGVTAAIGIGLAGMHYMPQSCTENEAEIKTPVTLVQHNGVYVDFRGVEHSDTLGNIKRIMEMKPEISAMLIAVEGYAEEAYKDGKGIWTIGSGTTFYLNEEGQHCKVKAGDRITAAEAMTHKWRFIEAEMLDLLGDKMGRECSNEELMACIGAGFCWGKNALVRSAFYKSVCDGESVEQQSRKSTGFRKQKGLLKREYLLSACLLGKWTGKDLLDMPIYQYKGQYLGSGIYRLKLSDIMPCKKDKKGNFLKDRKGHHIPVVAGDDFCSFFDNYGEIKEKLYSNAKYTLESVKTVSDFLPQEMIEAIKTRKNTVNFVQVMQQQADFGR